MSSDRRPVRYLAPTLGQTHSTRTPDGRYIRFSHRFNAWQVQDHTAGVWRNVRVELARAYVASGMPIGVQT